MNKLPELPGTFQNAFIAARAKAEAQYGNRHGNDPLDQSLHRLNLIQKVHRAYFKYALGACRAGLWTATQVSQSTDAAWPLICDFYFDREHWERSEGDRAKFRAKVWPAIAVDTQYRAHQLELAELAERVSPAPPPQSNRQATDDGGQVQSPGPGRRGRPQTIPDEKKAAAAAKKASGGTNKEAAQLIYDTKYPTAQQVKNVAAILKNHQQKLKRSDSPVMGRKAAPNPSKNRG
jgi:hypothetical protein